MSCCFRMSGLWGYQSALDLYLQENGMTTLLFGGVNTDQVAYNLVFIPRADIPAADSALEARSSMHTFVDTIAS